MPERIKTDNDNIFPAIRRYIIKKIEKQWNTDITRPGIFYSKTQDDFP